MPDSDNIWEKISELIPKLKAEVSVEVTISTGESDDVTEFIDALPDLDELTQEELLDILEKCREKLAQLEQAEPDEDDEDAHDEWEDQYSELEDKIDEIEDLLDELDD